MVVFADVASAPAALRLAGMVRELSPAVRIAAYGKGVLRIPAYFTRPPFDAAHVSGDQEAALLAWVDHLEGGGAPPGMWTAGGPPPEEGALLEPEEWGWPELATLPLDDYRRIARAKGIPFELSVYPARGCPHRECRYCDAWRHEGTVLRSRDPAPLLAWIDEAVRRFGFDCVQMHSANFCADPDWVERFCRARREQGASFPWTCCTGVRTLTPGLLTAIAAAGCTRVGVGVETLRRRGGRGPKASADRLAELSSWVEDAGLACKAYLMAGYPGQTEADLLFTFLTCTDLGLIARISTFTPFHDLEGLSAAELDRIDLARYDRKSFLPANGIPASTVLRLVVRPAGVEKWAQRRLGELP